MSMLPSSATYLASALENGIAEQESFQRFYECWIVEQDRYLHDLISAASNIAARRQQQQQQQQQQQVDQEQEREEDESILIPLTNQVIRHYEDYYRAKAIWIKRDVFSMFHPSWRSTLEDAYLWIGGWRPTMAFHLLYSKSGLQVEDNIDEFVRGIGGGTNDLGDLSPSQLVRLDELKQRTVREEREITERMAEQQERVADTSMVELSHLLSEGRVDPVRSERVVESTLEEKEVGMREVMERADDLRLRTFKAAIEVLKPIQVVHFLIAAAELHLRVHEWGGRRDASDHHKLSGSDHNG